METVTRAEMTGDDYFVVEFVLAGDKVIQVHVAVFMD
jgi:hypothetical protein